MRMLRFALPNQIYLYDMPVFGTAVSLLLPRPFSLTKARFRDKIKNVLLRFFARRKHMYGMEAYP